MLLNCSICLGDISLFNSQVSALNCGHFFHAKCLNDWLNVELNCPECRARVARGAFAANIYPKLNKDTANQIKSLEEKCGETANQLNSLQEKYSRLENDFNLLKMRNLSLNQS